MPFVTAQAQSHGNGCRSAHHLGQRIRYFFLTLEKSMPHSRHAEAVGSNKIPQSFCSETRILYVCAKYFMDEPGYASRGRLHTAGIGGLPVSHCRPAIRVPLFSSMSRNVVCSRTNSRIKRTALELMPRDDFLALVLGLHHVHRGACHNTKADGTIP
jgi:hypothetical protein